MALKQPPTDESALNMTPMIDIVFQLILFFMFNMKFKALDHRIDSAIPKDRGIQATAQFVEPIPAVKIALFRREEAGQKPYTYIEINDQPPGYKVPPVKFTGNPFADEKLHDQRYAIFQQIQQRISGLYATNKELKGEIQAPPPKGGLVPHQDVMGVLDAFLAAGITEVNFQGAGSPLPKAKKPAAAQPQ
jgi:biopolymer transport protein ExbD